MAINDRWADMVAVDDLQAVASRWAPEILCLLVLLYTVLPKVLVTLAYH